MKTLIKSPIAGHIIGIIGIAIGLFLWFISRQHPELSFSISPIRTNIVSSDATSKLRVYYGDREIKGELNAVQIAIWNNGNVPIRMSDTLSSIQLITKPPAPILELTLKQISRPEMRFASVESLFHEGKVPISWRIIEQDDGVIAQVTYEGNEWVDFSLVGSILNQRSPHRVFKEASEDKFLILIVIGVLIIAAIGGWTRGRNLKPTWLLIIVPRILSVVSLMYLIYLWVKFYAFSPKIPFSF